MYYQEINHNNYYLRLEKGEEIVASLQDFCEKHELKSGQVQAIGGLQSVSIGVYRLSSTKQYEWKEFAGDLELTSLMGNIAMSDEGRMLHLHATICNEALQAYGGHLKEAVVAGTVEIYIAAFTKPFSRVLNKDIGLKLLDFPKRA